MTTSIFSNAQQLLKHITDCETRYQKAANSVRLLGVSKTKSVAAISEAIPAGVHGFAENYLQEALPKIKELSQCDIEWHFIGNIQANKTLEIAQHFSWVQSVDRIKIAKLLSQYRATDVPPLNCLIQLNVDEELSKGGVASENIFSLAEQIASLPNLRLRGLMAIPKIQTDFLMQRRTFQKIYHLYVNLQQRGFVLDTLSMGMSDDFEAAIAEGATMVRIGTKLFGSR